MYIYNIAMGNIEDVAIGEFQTPVQYIYYIVSLCSKPWYDSKSPYTSIACMIRKFYCFKSSLVAFKR